MLIAKGSIVTIDFNGEAVQGALAEDFTIQLKSNFRPMMSEYSNSVTKAVDTLGGAVTTTFGSQYGFSSQTKHSTTQIWDKTDPARFDINIEFHRVPFRGDKSDASKSAVSGENVMKIVKKFCSIPLPGEQDPFGAPLGILIPPGPSVIEGIGADALVKEEGLVTLKIGSLRFNRLLMDAATPTFSKYSDDSEYPISCRVAFTFVSMWAATKPMVAGW
jgi:hypothetical protein